MLQISEIVRKTEEMFDLFNKHFYEGELNRPAITVSPDGGRGAYGWCSINEIWNASGEKYREINLGPVKNLCNYRSSMIIVGLKANPRGFQPLVYI